MNARLERWGHAFGVVTLAGLLAACDSGPGESEFIAACMNQGRTGANKALGNALGVDREKFCQCGAKTARAGMSDKGLQLMVWEMQGGKRQEIAVLQAKMSEEEKMAVMKAGIEVFGKCAGGG